MIEPKKLFIGGPCDKNNTSVSVLSTWSSRTWIFPSIGTRTRIGAADGKSIWLFKIGQFFWRKFLRARQTRSFYIGTVAPIRLLSVGPVGPDCLLIRALSGVPGFHISHVPDPRKLWTDLRPDVLDIAVFQNMLSCSELNDGACFVRQTWPRARILIIRDGGNLIDDSLYDDRVSPDVNANAFLITILRLVNQLDGWRFQDDVR